MKILKIDTSRCWTQSGPHDEQNLGFPSNSMENTKKKSREQKHEISTRKRKPENTILPTHQ